jgi:hypothetical protein
VIVAALGNGNDTGAVTDIVNDLQRSGLSAMGSYNFDPKFAPKRRCGR